MTYRVLYTRRAEAEALALARYIAEDSHERAVEWLKDLYDLVDTLERWPRRCVVSPADSRPGREVRKLNYGDYPVLYTIEEQSQSVVVLDVRHGAMLRGGPTRDVP